MSKKIRFFLLGCALMVMCCMGITAGATDNAVAKVVGHSLTITNEGISVNFYVDIDDVAQNGITVTLNDSQVDVPEETKEVIIDAKAYQCYVFTQPVVAKKMDDKVSLSIVAEGKEPVTDSYSVNDYVAEVREGGYGLNFDNLANAMTYYGEFAEVYFGYKGATNVSDAATDSISSVTIDNFDKYVMTVDSNMPKGLGYYGTQLNLNSEITLRLCFTVAEGHTANEYAEFVAEYGDSQVNLGNLKKVGDYYCVDIEGIGADALGWGYTIKCGGTTVLSNCSVLTYARAVVNAYSGKDNITDRQANLLNLSKALYLYNQKAVAYVEEPNTGVFDLFYNGSGFFAEPTYTNAVYLTSEGEVTTKSTGNTQITTLSQLNDSRTKGCSIWMEAAYTVSGNESLIGPYVIRRYTGNTGNVLSVTGTVTVKAKIDGSCVVTSDGAYIARYADGTTEVAIAESEDAVSADNSLVNVGANATFAIAKGGIIQNSHVANGEVYVSGIPTEFKVAGDAKSGVITAGVTGVTVTAEGLTKEAEVKFPNHAAQSLTGSGEVSGIKLVDDGDGHFGAIEKSDGSLILGSIICVCGDNVSEASDHECAWVDGINHTIEAVYGLNWQAYDASNTTLPTAAGYHYLAGKEMTLTDKASPATGKSVYLDLNGCIVTKKGGANAASDRVIQIEKASAEYSIADSKGSGTIQFASGYTTNQDGGCVFVTAQGSVNLYSGTIDMRTVKDPSNEMIEVYKLGSFNVHGGIIYSTTGTTTASSNCIYIKGTNTAYGILNVTGGTIYGEVIIRAGYCPFTVANDAKVGLPLPAESTNYGIGQNAAALEANETIPVNCKNLTEDAQIVLKSETNVTVTEEDGSNSKVSGFELVEGGKGGHYGVVKKSDDTFAFAEKICVCGADVSDNPRHTCEWLDGTTNTIDTVYSLGWQEWNTQLSKDSSNTSDPIKLPTTKGYYYLTEDMNLTNRAYVSSAKVYLDLNGHKATMASGVRVIYIDGTSASYSIADSSKSQEGRVQFADGYSISDAGGFAFYNQAGTINLYSGSIDMSNVAQAQANMIDVSKGSFNVHGGTIKPTATKASSVSNCIGVRGSTGAVVTVTGGTIYGEVILQTESATLNLKKNAKVGLPLTAESIDYGISAYESTTEDLAEVVCENVTAKAQIIFTSGNHITMSGTGELSAFTVLGNEYEIIDTDGQLSMQKKNNGE